MAATPSGIWVEKARTNLEKAAAYLPQIGWRNASPHFRAAAKYFVNAKLWDKAASAYIMAAKCDLILNMETSAVNSYADAAWCYLKVDLDESISCLYQTLSLCQKIGDDGMIAWCYTKLADAYVTKQNTEQAIVYYHRAAKLYESRGQTHFATYYQIKIAQLAAILGQYKKSAEIFTRIGYLVTKQQSHSFKEYLLDAGICQLCECRGETLQVKEALKDYQEINSSFQGTEEYRLLVNIVDAIDRQDIEKFVDAEMKFCIAGLKLDTWRTTLLSRAQQYIKQ